MRIIKFRAWRTDEKYMVTSDVGVLTALRNCYGNKGLAEQAGFSNIDNQPNPDKFILMQYTGRKDINDKEIFEGDIVSFDDCTSTESGYCERGCIGVVEWCNETVSFEVSNRLSAESYEVLDECVVIGNIYENPELLEGKE